MPMPRLPAYLLCYRKGQILILVIVLAMSFTALSVGEDQKALQGNDVCSLIATSKLADLIGDGEIVAIPNARGCKYVHPEASDGLIPPGGAELSVLDESPDQAKSRFEDQLKSSIKDIREGTDARILLVERGKGYAAYSDEMQARVLHGGRIVILYIGPPGAAVRTRRNSNVIRAIAIQAAGAPLDPNAQVGPPPGLPQRVQWTTWDEYCWRFSTGWLIGFVPLILLLIVGGIAFPILRRRRMRARGF